MADGAPQIDVGQRVKRARESRRLTQLELATLAELGIDSLRAIEQGRTPNPGIRSIVAIARALEMTIDGLVLGD